MLSTISSLGKQKLILSYTWLKDQNPKVDWKKGKVCITCCLPQCEGYCTLWKEQTLKKRQEVQAMQYYWTGPLSLLDKEEKEFEAPCRTDG